MSSKTEALLADKIHLALKSGAADAFQSVVITAAMVRNENPAASILPDYHSFLTRYTGQLPRLPDLERFDRLLAAGVAANLDRAALALAWDKRQQALELIAAVSAHKRSRRRALKELEELMGGEEKPLLLTSK